MKLPNYGFVVLFVLCCAFLIIAPVAAYPVLNEGNGHYYEDIIATGITWSEANSAAQSMTYRGVQGHLATINSEDENIFIRPMIWTLLDWNYYWIGGFQPIGSTEPDGGWQWVTGEPWTYANWDPPNPSNTGAGNENSLEMLTHWPYHLGTWNDVTNDNPDFRAYIRIIAAGLGYRPNVRYEVVLIFTVSYVPVTPKLTPRRQLPAQFTRYSLRR